MPAPVTLPRHVWGAPDAGRRALLVHGLGSNGPLMWRFATALADEGWQATAVDLRGHGSAPRALDYTIAAYASDVAATKPDDDGAWDLVVGHSLGGAAAVVAAAENPTWARRLVLIDPGIHLTEQDRRRVRDGQRAALTSPTAAALRAENPHWHELDVELKLRANAESSGWAVDQTSVQNQPWDVRIEAAALRVPTHVIAADPAIWSLFGPDLRDEVLRNPAFTASTVAGAGHSPHRDDPDETLRQLRAALADEEKTNHEHV